MSADTFVHPTALVEDTAEVGDQTKIWNWSHIRRGARIGRGCILGKGVFVDADVQIGSNCKLQNNVSVFSGVTIEDGVFVGPHVCFTNDKLPRAISPDGELLDSSGWQLTETLVKHGASIGANATIVCGVTIGKWSMIAAGSVVSKSVPDYALVQGNPARVVGVVAPSGEIVSRNYATGTFTSGHGESVEINTNA